MSNILNFKNLFRLALLLILASIFIIFFTKKLYNYDNYIKINLTTIKIEIANTPELKYQGLSGRKSLCANCGMLFIFKNKTRPTFVMRQMYFPLDIIWIEDDSIKQIDKNLSPEGEQPINFYQSQEDVNYVLEVNAGYSDKNNIKVGDKIEFFIKNNVYNK